MKKLGQLVLSTLLACLFLGLCFGTALADEGVRPCPSCGESVQTTYDSSRHTVICAACGYESVDAYHSWGYFSLGDNTHAYGCAVCGYENWTQSHYAYCDAEDTSVCRYCKAQGVTINLDHVSWGCTYVDDTTHNSGCTSCGYVYRTESHYADCGAEDTSVCMYCKAQGVTTKTEHASCEWTYVDDATCGYTCKTCGYISSTDSHYAYCDAEDTSVCYICDAQGVTTKISHSYLRGVRVDYNTCGYKCNDCGEIVETYSHYSYDCSSEACARCRSTDVKLTVYHSGQWVQKSDELQHWYECSNCGYKQSYGTHRVVCSDKTVCLECGQENCKYNYIEHEGETAFTHDNVRHYEVCGSCGDTLRYEVHHTDCDAEDTSLCEECGAEGVQTELSHTNWDYAYLNATTHAWGCVSCGYVRYEETHYGYCDDTEKCVDCGAQGCTLADIYHGDYDLVSNKTSHWRECPLCGLEREGSREAHWEECPEAGVCAECGMTNCEMERSIGHDWQKDGETQPGYCANYTCTQCGAVKAEEAHTVSCKGWETTCLVCGMEDVDRSKAEKVHQNCVYRTSIEGHWRYCADCYTDLKAEEGVEEHDIDYSKEAFNEQGHYNPCRICGGYRYISTHYVYCYDLTHCSSCDYENPNGILNAYVYHDYELCYDSEKHWYACTHCGDVREYDNEAHKSTCANPTLCMVCHQTYDGSNVQGHVSIDWSKVYTDATHHWYKCTACGEECQKTEHMACCSDPDKCDFCQMEGYTGGNVFHDGAYGGYGPPSGKYVWKDDKTHVYCCGWCGEAVETWYHNQWGDADATICAQCGGKVACKEHTWEWAHNDVYTHTRKCSVCGETDGSQRAHIFKCTDPDVCAECGSTEGRGDVQHSGRTRWTSIDKLKHTSSCADCGTVLYTGGHGFSCDRVCRFCGETDCEGEGYDDDFGHVCDSDKREYRSNGEYHWTYYPECGTEDTPVKHTTYCDDRSLCVICGESNCTDFGKTRHNGETVYDHNGALHWQACGLCGAALTSWNGDRIEAPHTYSCEAPTVCTVCGAEDVERGVVDHGEGLEWRSNDTEHWELCYLCGYISERTPHTASCTDEFTCSVCAETGVEIDDINHGYMEWHRSDTAHWQACANCGTVDESTRGLHMGGCHDPNSCRDCFAMDVIFAGTDGHIWQEGEETVYWACSVQVCLRCGQEKATVVHTPWCDDPTTCARCGRTGLTTPQGDVQHRDMKWLADQYGHSGECAACGEITQRETHTMESCDIELDPSARTPEGHFNSKCSLCGWYELEQHFVWCIGTDCVACNYAFSQVPEEMKMHDSYYTADETYHWRVCWMCGTMEGEKEPHYASCSDPYYCLWCNKKIATPLPVTNHTNIDWSTVYHDDTHHWYKCRDCGGETQKAEHQAACSAPGVCDFCQAEYTGDNVFHADLYDGYSISSNDYTWVDIHTHTYNCAWCHEPLKTHEHAGRENDPFTCMYCGGQMGYCGMNDHKWAKTAQYVDAQHHALTCTVCGVTKADADHRALCTDTNVCLDCGQSGITVNAEALEHRHTRFYSDEYYHYELCEDCGIGLTDFERHDWQGLPPTAEGHWQVCAVCDFEKLVGQHYASCLAPDNCYGCDYEGELESVHLYHEEREYIGGRYGHRLTCTGCGAREEMEPHETSCADVFICVICHYDTGIVGDVTRHTNIDFSQFYTDGQYHWYKCLDCGGEALKSEHIACCTAPTTCDTCQMEGYTGGRVFHSGHYNDEGGYGDYWEGGYNQQSECVWKDAGTHYYKCSFCHGALYEKEHVIDLENPGHCRYCLGEMNCPESLHNWVAVCVDEEKCGLRCTVCGQLKELDGHRVTCDAPNTCLDCGAQGELTLRETEHKQLKYTWKNGGCHLPACELCGVKLPEEAHTPSDRDSTLCKYCGGLSDYKYCSGSHYEGDIYGADVRAVYLNDMQHNYVCDICGEVLGDSYHEVGKCTEVTDYCEECDHAISPRVGSHNRVKLPDGEYVYNENYHCDEVCLDCGSLIYDANFTAHSYTCEEDAAGKCSVCGYEGENVPAQHDFWLRTFDETSHTYVCGRCGYVLEEEHYIYCHGVYQGGWVEECVECYYPNDGSMPLKHTDFGESFVHYNEFRHWYFCGCGKVALLMENHYTREGDTPGVCSFCGIAYEVKEACADGQHESRCDAPNWCDLCGHEYDGSNVTHHVEFDLENPGYCRYCQQPMECPEGLHSWVGVYVFIDETYHGDLCTVCGKTALLEEHLTYEGDPAGICSVCDYQYAAPPCPDGEHESACDAPTLCVKCGYDYDGSNVTGHTQLDDTQFIYDSAYHWYKCLACQGEVQKAEHEAACDVPDLCTLCGMTGYTGENVLHDEPEYVWQDVDTHWFTCSRCEEEFEEQAHVPSENDSALCEQCGGQIGHCADDEHDWSNGCEPVDDTYHGSICTKCAAVDNVEKHYTNEGDPEGVCSACGSAYEPVPPCPEGEHVWDEKAVYLDDAHHTLTCTVCGETSEDDHYVVCGDAGYCVTCEHEVSPRPVNHVPGSNAYYDEDAHWFACKKCFTETGKEAHYTNEGDPEGVCSKCGQSYNAQEPCPDDEHIWGDVGSYLNDAHHTLTCTVCGETGEGDHYVICGNAGYCTVCEHQVSPRPVHHVAGSNAYYNEDEHWFACEKCFIETGREAHYTDEGDPEGICSKCGQSYEAASTPTPTPEPDEPTPTPEPDEPTPTPEPDEPTPTPTLEPTPTPTIKPSDPTPTRKPTTPPTPTPTPDIIGEVVMANRLPEGEVKEPTLMLPEGVTDDGSLRLIYELTEGNAADDRITYDVSLKDHHGVDVALPGECTLIFPYPKDLNASDRSKYFVTIRHTRSDGVVDVYTSQEGTVQFLPQGLGVKVDSLSPFEITWVKNPALDNLPPTGDTRNPWLDLMLLMAGAGALAFTRRKLRRA